MLLAARTFEELHERLPRLDVVVSSHLEKGHDAAERYSIVRLLGTVPLDLSDFPLQLLKDERPDFTLQLAGRLVGIEHTQVMSENAVREAKMRASQGRDGFYFVRPATVEDPRKSRQDLQKEIEEDRMPPPMMGDSVERNWAEAIAAGIAKKVVSARKPAYRAHDQYWLAIYDNWPAPALARERALVLLQERLPEIEPFTIFEKIFILTGTMLVELRRGQALLHRMNRRRRA